MSRDGNGTYSLPEAPFVFNTVIDETAVNNNFSDIGSALTQSLAKDGQTVPTANLPMGNFKHTGVGNGTARNHYASVAQVQDGAVAWGGTAGGTADALTINLSPAITAYATGMTIQFIASADSTTTTPTINVNSAGVKTIVDEAGNALVAGDIANGDLYEIVYDGTNFRLKFNGSATGTAAARDVGVASGNLATVNQAVTDTASATTVTLGTTLEHNITGTTTVTAFNGVAGVTYHCRSAGAFILTNGVDLLLPTSANITTEAGDTFDVYMIDADTALIRNYQRKSGEPLVSQSGITLGTPTAWTSGTAVDFTGSEILASPSRVTVGFSGISLSGSANVLVQIGDSGGFKTTGYAGSSSNNGTTVLNHSTGVQCNISGSTLALYGNIVFSLLDAANYIWSYTGTLSTGGGNICNMSGAVTLNGALDRVRVTTSNGTDTGDAGTLNVSSEV